MNGILENPSSKKIELENNEVVLPEEVPIDWDHLLDGTPTTAESSEERSINSVLWEDIFAKGVSFSSRNPLEIDWDAFQNGESDALVPTTVI